MEEMLQTVRDLAEQIGPRPPTSATEARAAAYVNSAMRQAGLDVDVQTFRAPPTFSLPYGLLLLLFALTPPVSWYNPPIALAGSLVALFLWLAEVLSFPLLSRLFAWKKSQNIVATRPAAQEARQHLIVLAHLDTARPALFFHPRVLRNFRRAFLLLVFALAALPLLCALEWWFRTPWLWYAQWLPAGYAALALLLMLHQETRPYVPGANDNASGLAILLHLARELDNLQYTDLWLVATGCHEAGLFGTWQFLRQYPFPRESTFLLNLDSLGRGQPAIVVEEGMLWAYRADPLLAELANQADAAEIVIDAEPRTYRTMHTDAQVAFARHYRALSLIGLKGGEIPNWHRPEDTADRVEPQLLDRAARLAGGIARRLDRRFASGIERLPEPEAQASAVGIPTAPSPLESASGTEEDLPLPAAVEPPNAAEETR